METSRRGAFVGGRSVGKGGKEKGQWAVEREKKRLSGESLPFGSKGTHQTEVGQGESNACRSMHAKAFLKILLVLEGASKCDPDYRGVSVGPKTTTGTGKWKRSERKKKVQQSSGGH